MKRLGFVLIILLLIFIICGFYNELEVTYYTYKDKVLPEDFDGYRIAFLSDLHCKEYGNEQEKLLHKIDSLKPDIVVLTGDLIDEEHSDITPVKDLLSGLSGRYRVYAVSGNHEFYNYQNYKKLLDYYRDYGVINLDHGSRTISRNSSQIGIYGSPYQGNDYSDLIFQAPNREKNEFNILLYHDAAAFQTVSDYDYNLILSGHTHGGIVRLPLVGGLFNNNGSLLSEYDNGMYFENNSTLISSRGLGDAFLPRFYNRSEIVCVTLESTR